MRRLPPPRRDGGFTLVELAVCLLIVGILVAIAMPVFRSVVAGSQDEQIQADLRAAFEVQGLVFLTRGDYTADEAALHAVEPTLRYSAVGEPGALTVITRELPATGVCLFGLSHSGRWWSVYYAASGPPRFGEAAPVPCTAALAAAWSTGSW